MILGPVNHRARRADLRLPDRAACLDLDNDGIVEVDQVIGGVGEEGMPFERTGPLCGGVRLRDELRPDLAGSAPSSLVQRVQILPDRARVAAIASQSISSDAAAERCLFASALIKLASAAKPLPPTSPSAMQRRTVVSNSSRSRSQSRKRP